MKLKYTQRKGVEIGFAAKRDNRATANRRRAVE